MMEIFVIVLLFVVVLINAYTLFSFKKVDLPPVVDLTGLQRELHQIQRGLASFEVVLDKLDEIHGTLDKLVLLGEDAPDRSDT